MSTLSLKNEAFSKRRLDFLSNFMDCFGCKSIIIMKMYNQLPSEKNDDSWIDSLIESYGSFCDYKGVPVDKSLLRGLFLKDVNLKNPDCIVTSYAVDVELILESSEKPNLYLAFDLMCSGWEYDVVVIPIKNGAIDDAYFGLSLDEIKDFSIKNGFGIYFSSGHLFRDEAFSWLGKEYVFEYIDFFYCYGNKYEIEKLLRMNLGEQIISELSNL